jgi:hypothetical protein
MVSSTFENNGRDWNSVTQEQTNILYDIHSLDLLQVFVKVFINLLDPEVNQEKELWVHLVWTLIYLKFLWQIRIETVKVGWLELPVLSDGPGTHFKISLSLPLPLHLNDCNRHRDIYSPRQMSLRLPTLIRALLRQSYLTRFNARWFDLVSVDVTSHLLFALYTRVQRYSY